uniref:Uncharacterized protein n=1 Tax=Mus musculus TaxID=10090 RepID=Q3UXH4_MOUSE|nr:unnamed protein product [Mus musculus]
MQKRARPTHMQTDPSPSGLFTLGEEKKALYRHSVPCFSFQHLHPCLQEGVGNHCGQILPLQPRARRPATVTSWGPLLAGYSTPPRCPHVLRQVPQCRRGCVSDCCVCG